MGLIRNGARTWLNLIAKACKFTHMRGFRAALDQILGPETAATVMGLWTPFCAAVEALISADNWYNQIDALNDDGEGEDLGV